MRVWGLVTRGRETRDLGTSSMGRGDVWDGDGDGDGDGDAGRQIQGRGDVNEYCKIGGKCDISFFVKICYLWSTLDSIVQNHIGHLMMFTQNISSR